MSQKWGSKELAWEKAALGYTRGFGDANILLLCPETNVRLASGCERKASFHQPGTALCGLSFIR